MTLGWSEAAQELYLSLEALHDAVCGRVACLEEDGCADELVALGSVHRSVRPDPQRVVLRLDQPHVTEAEAAPDQQLLRHSLSLEGERNVEKTKTTVAP